MNAKPILFSADMVRALLNGQKTQTRRIIKPQPLPHQEWSGWVMESTSRKEIGCARWSSDGIGRTSLSDAVYARPPARAGDLLYVRETWRQFDSADECDHMDFPCSCPTNGAPIFRATHDDGESAWKPSIHMPRWASRLTLRITSVRVERLQDISQKDAIAEGCDSSESAAANSTGWYEKPVRAFQRLWESTYSEDNWASNPWVWVVEFEVIQANVDRVIEEAA
ncbi:hypothetical protein [Neptuniibacter halophilus]|uniref:hypothetical protein n=1 Tax=Neptuniibacter halophilus TaxID=651666 RepID=UPI002573828C|nr:hypothetical protein [Neptuniibacter halophilus]